MGFRIRSLVFLIIFLSVATIDIGTYKARANRHLGLQPAGQGQDRLVVDKSRSDAPVRITLIRTKKRVIETDKKFLDDDDWLRGLTLRVVNRSDKTVTYVGVQLIFRRTEDQESGLPAGWPFNYGFDPFRLNPGDSIPSPQVTPILARRDIEITLSDVEHNEVQRFLAEAGFPASRKRIELDVIKVGFSDGTAWNNGRMYRRNPASLEGPLKGWSPLDDPGGTTRRAERPIGSARNGTAFL
jgi:hypothetical protein